MFNNCCSTYSHTCSALLIAIDNLNMVSAIGQYIIFFSAGTPVPNHLGPSIGAQNQSEAWTLGLSVKSFNKHQLVLTWNAPTPEQEVAQLQLTYHDVKHAQQHQVFGSN